MTESIDMQRVLIARLFASLLVTGLVHPAFAADKAKQQTLGGTHCAVGEVLKYDGDQWACATDSDTLTTEIDWSSITNRPAGLDDGDDDTDTLSALACAEGQTAKSDGAGTWHCAEDDTGSGDGDVLASLGCQAGDVAQFNGTDWECSDAVSRLLTLQVGKRVFLTADTYNGNFFGLDGADMHCSELAREVSLPGTYRAWLSDDTGSPSTRFVRSSTPYILVNGTVVADDWSDLTDGDIDHVINVDQYGNEVPVPTYAGSAQVWSNTEENGALNLNLEAAHCDNWTSTTETGAIGVYSSTETPSESTEDYVGSQLVRLGWTRLQALVSEDNPELGYGEVILPCSGFPKRLYCFQQ